MLRALLSRSTLPLLLLCALFCWIPNKASASGGHGVGAELWLGLAAMIVLAKLGGELAQRLKQPPVLGELFAGIVLGNLALLGWDGAHFLLESPSIEFLAELGVALLLFEVGLESTLTEMRKVAPQSGAVAVLGVVAPMALGYGATTLLLPDASHTLHLFVGATLCATSVGITARVLKDMGALQVSESRVILGAAVIDDVLGLLILAVVSSIARLGELPSSGKVMSIVGVAVGFLVGAMLVGAYLMPGVYRISSRLRTGGTLVALSIAFCLFLAGVSALAGLAAIVGAFAAGLVLDEVHVAPFGKKSALDIGHYIAPVVAFLGPVFFVRTGMMVDLSGVTGGVIVLALALSLVGVVGKLLAGLGVRGQAVDRLAVGIGMVPRGEVGLIFANVGASIRVDGHPLIEPGVFAAVVLMVMVSTIVTPPWLAQRFRKILARSPSPAVPPEAHESSAAA